MSITKKDIAKEITKNAEINFADSQKILDAVINFIKYNSKKQSVKIQNFGTFFYKLTLQRIGRNPKTKESYIISPRKKLIFKPSNSIKKILN